MSEQILTGEQSVLGSMFRDAGIVRDVLHTVREDDFLLDADRKIFRACRELYAAGKPVDAVTVRDRVGSDYQDYLLQLMEVTPTSANWEEYAAIMRNEAAVSRVHDLAGQLRETTRIEDCCPLIEDMRLISSGSRRTEAFDVTQLLEDFVARQTSGEDPDYIRYGLAPVDDVAHTRLGHVVVLAARPSDGKTALALQLALEMAKTRSVGFFSLETGREDIADRMAASAFGVDLGSAMGHKLDQSDWDAVAARSGELAARKFKLIHCPAVTAERITSASEAYGFEVIFVDYLQLVTPTDARSTRNDQVAQISRDLHTFAQRTKTLVFELSQLSRQEKGGWREPDLPDLRESGQIEQDADMVMFIFRPPADGGLDENTTRYLKIAKQKNGRRMRRAVYFDGAHQRFSVLDTTRADAAKAMQGYAAKGKNIKAQRRPHNDGQVKLEELSAELDVPF